MGLIRKSLMIGTAGVVSGSSKKQRVAKAQLRELKAQTAIMKAAVAQEEANMRAERNRLDREHAELAARRRAALEASATFGGATSINTPVQQWAPAQAPPQPSGFYPSPAPGETGLDRYWDGAAWTAMTRRNYS